MAFNLNQKIKKKMGKIAYAFNGAKSIFSTKSIKLKIKYEGGEIEGRYAIILINNSRYTAGMPLNKKVNLCDGLVDVMLIESKKEKVNLITVIKTIFMFLSSALSMIRSSSCSVRILFLENV